MPEQAAKHGSTSEPESGSTAAGGTIRRAELLLSGNRVRSLLESLLAWSAPRLGAIGHALFVPDDDGLKQTDALGDIPADMASELARAAWIGESVENSAEWQVFVLEDNNRRFAVLVSHLDALIEEDPRDAMHGAAHLLAHRLPSALELERLHRAMQELAEAERLQRALYQIADLASGERHMGEVLGAIHRVVAELMYAENFYIALYDAEKQLMSLPYFQDGIDTTPPIDEVAPVSEWEGSLTLHVLRTGRPLMGPSYELMKNIGLNAGGFGANSEAWLGVPMMRGAEVIGVLVVQSYDSARRYTDKDRALLKFVAQHIATALERLRLHEELERRVRERTEELSALNETLRGEVRERERGEKLQAALFHIAELGSSSDSLDAVFSALHAVIDELIHAKNFYIALLSEDGTKLDFPYSIDERDMVRDSRPLDQGLTERVLDSGQPLLASSDVIEGMQRSGELNLYGAVPRAWLGVPLIYDNRTVGVMAIQVYDGTEAYDRRDQNILTFVSYHVANALQRKQQADFLREANVALERRVRERTEALASANDALREQIAERERAERRFRHAALHDALTGLPNRNLLLDHMDKALRRYRQNRQAMFAVMFLDLDRFKVVNDSVGHLVGDELLKSASARILAQLPDNAIIARLGGDEFAVLIESPRATEEAPEVAARIIASLDDPLHVVGRDIYSSTSIGIAFAQPYYRTVEEPLRDADVALYRAKAEGRRRYEIFDEALRHQALLQMELEGNLRRALERREFEPVFQPIFDLDSRKVRGFEALLRWRHPQRGLVTPGEFLRQAEESGLSEAIDWQVFDSAFAQSGPLLGSEAYLGINVGTGYLRSPQFADTLMRRLDAANFNPAQLRIEVTESALLQDPVQSRVLMDRLRSYGITMALDDFGTGYSSLSYLHQFPLQALKIDQSFISPLDKRVAADLPPVLRAIHTLGVELGLEVIAEGIETEEQLERVKDLGEVYGQGFLLARPASVHSLLAAGLHCN